MALVHYPVINKSGEIIASAVTNLDLHDIARAAKTYGVKKVYIITPLDDQKELVQKIVSHWTLGGGSRYNALRKEALELIEIEESLESAVRHIEAVCSVKPRTIMTCARDVGGRIGFREIREKFESGEPYLLVFGTAWGLAESLLETADYVLEPIRGNTGYNHLSVRSAASIMLDRLLPECC
ncbi:MAG: RNA methyltransferase [Desulfobacteraceae bacterium]|nr:RNA methyltransferase [Desulfobacteraceae bacterium]MBU4002121.1 RNA methyltransferase [Pseudomonadota bacterium]MBU4054657.1 RNA methyltransferase [Pseudomonadota bacterium]